MKHRVFNISLFVVYIIAMTSIMIWQGIGLAPDRFAFLLLFASLFVKRTRNFILDWLPFLFILLSYDFLRGFADNVGARIHFSELIEMEKILFGNIPTIELQKLLFNPSNPSLLDYSSSVIYFLHFALPLTFGFILWMVNRTYFKQFVTGILLLSYSAWFTYIIFPAAPPWLAQDEGYISGVYKIMDITLSAFPDRWGLPTIYHQFNPNPVAAMPSLHAAYPLLVFLFAVKFFKKKAIAFIFYVLAVWFSITYLGEHYVVDVIAGAIYAIIFFFVSSQVLHKVKWEPFFNRITQKS